MLSPYRAVPVVTTLDLASELGSDPRNCRKTRWFGAGGLSLVRRSRCDVHWESDLSERGD